MKNLKNSRQFFESKENNDKFEKIYNWFVNNKDIVDEIDFNEDGYEEIKIIIDDNNKIFINIKDDTLYITTITENEEKEKEVIVSEEEISKLRELLKEIENEN